VLKNVNYDNNQVQYTTGNTSGKEYLRLTFKPVTVVLNGQTLNLVHSENQPGYLLRDLGNHDYSLIVNRNGPGVVNIYAE
jgi:hypothetical protein